MRYFALLFLLVACSPESDLQGRDPNAYYAKHPKINKVETRSLTHEVKFARGAGALELSEKTALYQALRNIAPEASESILVQFSPAQLHNQARRNSIQKSLRSFGFTSDVLAFEPSQSLGADDARVTLSYATVVSPHCPDWRMSPTNNYSNNHQGHLGCASVVNLGLMVANPRDLVHGQGDGRMDTERNMLAIRDYRAGKTSASEAASGAAMGAAATAVDSVSGGQ
ncbi:MAG: hypothetical protein EBR02_06700 [Alphaproteobacteria bacterium]|nr:hypothetical protein [Alphaproteobacteria bacterium]